MKKSSRNEIKKKKEKIIKLNIANYMRINFYLFIADFLSSSL